VQALQAVPCVHAEHCVKTLHGV